MSIHGLMQPEAMFVSMGHAVTRVPINVSGLCFHVSPCWCPWSGLPLRALSGFVVLLQLGTMFVSALSPETTWKPMIHDPVDCKEQGSYFDSDTPLGVQAGVTLSTRFLTPSLANKTARLKSVPK